MLDADLCYRALAVRDARFDGRFFTAVKTTGVYCRPVCPARTPRPDNVRFYASAAAAEEAGFRPCLRCRPEAAPGTPGWLGTAGTVSRALTLISRGALDGGGVEELGRRLGVGARHLSRLFLEHVGATPAAVARTRRVHFAKRLLDDTRLPMPQLAQAAGFGSVRRLSEAVRLAYGRPPRELRANGGRATAAAPGAGAELELRLSLRPPFDGSGLLAFLADRAIPGVEAVAEGEYRRTVAIGDFRGTIRVRLAAESDPFVLLAVPAAAAPWLLPIVGRTRRLLDLDADPREIGDRLARDPLFRETLGRRPGLRVPGAWDGFELAVRGVLGQQVSVRGATTLAGRLVRLAGAPLESPAGDALTHHFPTARAVASADLSAIGMPAARGEALRALARAVRDGAVDLDGGMAVEEVTDRLVAIPGIGPWTARYVAMRALGDPDAFPSGDLGVRRALARGDRLPTEAEVEARSQGWRPWRAYAVIALWTRDTGTPGRAGTRSQDGNDTNRARLADRGVRSGDRSRRNPRAAVPR